MRETRRLPVQYAEADDAEEKPVRLMSNHLDARVRSPVVDLGRTPAATCEGGPAPPGGRLPR